MPGVGKLDYVIAHDHCMSTLNGYKRNDSGGFYTKWFFFINIRLKDLLLNFIWYVCKNLVFFFFFKVN
jgi:hypothetical protein